MRFLGKLLALSVILGGLASSGFTQPNCGPYGCPQPYPRYYGYGVSSSNYYRGQLPPYLMGGPAYGYTYPNPYYGYNPYPPGPPAYIAPPYYAHVYQPNVYSHSGYSPLPAQYSKYYPPLASVKSLSNSSPAAKDTKPSAKQTLLPGKELPPAAANPPAKQPPPATAKKSSLFRRMLYW